MWLHGEFDESGDSCICREPEEEFRYIPGFEGLYAISNYGDIFQTQIYLVLIDAIQGLAGAGYIDIPKHWQSSSFQGTRTN